jgi:hypothetical protein
MPTYIFPLIAWPRRAVHGGEASASPDGDQPMKPQPQKRLPNHQPLPLQSLALLCAVLLTAAGAGAATAQLPFGTPPLPESGARRQCTKDYRKSLEAQVAAMEKMRTAGPEFVGEICKIIESGSALFGGELSDTTRQQLKDWFGFDIDLRFIKTQCRVGQGNLDRELTTQLGFLKSEIIRCNDSI